MSYLLAVPGFASPSGYVRPGRWAQEDRGDLWPVGFCYNVWNAPQTIDSRGSWGFWPSRSSFASDPSAPTCLIFGNSGQDMNNMSRGPWREPLKATGHPGGGSQSAKCIMGQCQDASTNPVGGAVVKAIRTSDGILAGTSASDSNGRYEVPCANTPTDQHYCVAYVDSTTDLGGTTVNTLVPTWRDGSV